MAENEKKEKEQEQKTDPVNAEGSTESSMIEEHTHQDPEMLLSAEEDTSEDKLVYEEKASLKEGGKEADEPEDGVDGSALVAESEKKNAITLVSEADLSDDDLEKEDDTQEVHSDEDHHDEHEEQHEVMPDYAELSPEELVAAAAKLLKSEPIQALKKHFEGIRTSILKQLNEERKQKLEQFIKEGGTEIDFEFIQPVRENFRKIYGEYRSKRQKHFQELEAELKSNLVTKQALIEQIKELVNKEESIGDTFREFNKIQQEWRNTGPVPRNESSDLYRTYHHHVENFYEYIKINKELRDLDFKKNREQKEALIKEAEVLLEKKDVPAAFKELQQLHRKWKNVGPVERENREPLWQSFSEITHKLHEKREAYYGNLREKAGEMVEAKKGLIEELKQIPANYDAHHKWQKAMKQVDEVAGKFRKIGRVNHPENDKVWEQFRQVIRDFNHAKNQFYKGLKKQHHENLKKKQALVEIAENLKDSEDWQQATNEFKRIQADWKRIGHVPKSESDKIWKQFRAACNHFFDRLTEQNKQRDKSLLKNLEAKRSLLENLKNLELAAGDQKKSVATLKEVIKEWKAAGQVPRGEAKIEKDFNQVLDTKFKAIDLDRKESQKIRFENKMDSMSSHGGVSELNRERSQVQRQIDEAKKELGQLETNLSFFTSSNPKNPFIKEAEKNIQRQREQIEMLQEKHKMLNVRIRGIRKAEEESQAKDASPEAED